MMAGAPILEAQGLTKRYGGLVANNDVRMALAPGEIRGLIGPNGAVTSVKGFEIIVIGGLGSIPGALIGGLLLGLVESLGAAFISSPYQNVYGFLLVILILIVKPNGLFGERGREA
jgi:branched-subunit amino acid ABC-type transport system permease component